jgi:hypothetical protein
MDKARKQFSVMELEERIAPAIMKTVDTTTTFTKHPGPTDTQTTVTETTASNPAGNLPPGQQEPTTVTTTEVKNRFAR